jgi:membrane fusion protein (multidrug efflux system)
VAVARADAARCQARIGYLEVRAPFDGVVVSRAVATGSFVRSADVAGAGPVGRLVSDERLRVVFDVPAQDALMLTAGSGAAEADDAPRGNRVRIHLGSAGGTLEGRVSRIAGSLDRRSRTLRCEVDVSNGDRRLRPGMFVRVEVELELRSNVLSVPVRALIHERRRPHVFVVREGHARLVDLHVGIDDGDWVEVIDGLARGEPVVVAGQDGLRDGAKVDPRLAPSDAAGDAPADPPR